MPTHIPFPKIGQYRNVVKYVRDRSMELSIPLPVIKYIGSVKLHGTNSGLVFPETGGFYCQSRTRVIKTDDDNYGFTTWARTQEETTRGFQGSGLVIYGEWCGQGIQSGVAISQLPKMFIVFAIRELVSKNWFSPLEILQTRLESVYSCGPVIGINIDFNNPELTQNDLVIHTERVEQECPIGKHFGISGIGEGIVWWPLNPPESFHASDLAFKVKGVKHSESHVKILAAVDTEKIENIQSLVDAIITDHRLEKQIDALKEEGGSLDIKNTGAFLRLACTDVWKEEQDTILASGLPEKEVMRMAQRHVKNWWMQRIK